MNVDSSINQTPTNFDIFFMLCVSENTYSLVLIIKKYSNSNTYIGIIHIIQPTLPTHYLCILISKYYLFFEESGPKFDRIKYLHNK